MGILARGVSARCGDGISDTLRVTRNHHHPRPPPRSTASDSKSRTYSYNPLTIAALRTRQRGPETWEEINELAESRGNPVQLPLPKAGSVLRCGVTETSETLVCNGNSSCPAQAFGPLPELGPQSTCTRVATPKVCPTPSRN